MECQNPIIIRERGKDVPAFKRDYITVPCGRCFNCQMNKASQWARRIMDEARMHDDNCFITLTYNEEHLPRVSDTQGTLVKRDLQNFMKRLRKALSPCKVRFFACGEYGEQYARPHYHIIGFGVSDRQIRILENCWPYGFVSVGSLTYGSACYVARYTTKLLTGDKKKLYKKYNILPEFALMSRRPGIGVPFLDKVSSFAKSHRYLRNGEYKQAIPRLYRSKIWQTEEDKRELQDYMRNVMREQSEKLAKEFGVEWYVVRDTSQFARKTKMAELYAKKRLSLKSKNPL